MKLPALARATELCDMTRWIDNLPKAKAGLPSAAPKTVLGALNWHGILLKFFFAAFFLFSAFMAHILFIDAVFVNIRFHRSGSRITVSLYNVDLCWSHDLC